MDIATRPTHDVTTPSGYVLTVVDYVTLRDEKEIWIKMAEIGKDTDKEKLSEEQLYQNRTHNLLEERSLWTGKVIRGIKCPDGTVVAGEQEIIDFTLDGVPRYVAKEIQEEIDEAITPKKAKPTTSDTSQA